jgi:hypothetical protein
MGRSFDADTAARLKAFDFSCVESSLDGIGVLARGNKGTGTARAIEDRFVRNPCQQRQMG